MKFKKISALLIAAAVSTSTVHATGLIAGATEFTQIANNLQLVVSYEQQVESYLRQGQQLQAQLKNLTSNPTSVLGADVGNMINTIGKLYDGGQSIGYNIAQIDRNFATMFKNPQAADYGQLFTRWHKTNTDTLEATLKAVGVQRSQYASSQAALTELYNRSQATSGNLDALQTLSQINVRQTQELLALKELLASQAQAQATYMATQTAKDEKVNQTFQYKPVTIPPIETAPAPKWKNFGKN